ncbi:MAG: hypothetical protein V1875_01030 [Candidatus Altiarchaeota archaeon]
MSNIIQPPQNGGGYRRGESPVDSISPAQAGGSEIVAFTLFKTCYRLGFRSSSKGTEYFAERDEGGKWMPLMPDQFNTLEKNLTDEMKMMGRGRDSTRLEFEGPYDIFQARLEALLGRHARHIQQALGERPEAKDMRNVVGPMMRAGLTRALSSAGFDMDTSGIMGSMDEAVAREWLGVAERQYPTDTQMFGARVCVLTAVQDYATSKLNDQQNPPTMQDIAAWLKDTKTAEETLKRLNSK